MFRIPAHGPSLSPNHFYHQSGRDKNGNYYTKVSFTTNKPGRNGIEPVIGSVSVSQNKKGNGVVTITDLRNLSHPKKDTFTINARTPAHWNPLKPDPAQFVIPKPGAQLKFGYGKYGVALSVGPYEVDISPDAIQTLDSSHVFHVSIRNTASKIRNYTGKGNRLLSPKQAVKMLPRVDRKNIAVLEQTDITSNRPGDEIPIKYDHYAYAVRKNIRGANYMDTERTTDAVQKSSSKRNKSFWKIF